MNFIQSIKTCFRKYANFKGRAMRSEFWWFQLFAVVMTYGAMTLDHLFLGYTFEDVATPLAIIAMVGVALPTLSVTCRRLHDIGWSGWVQLPGLVTYSAYLDVWFPGFGISTIGAGLMMFGSLFWFALLILLIKGSQLKTNKYGADPHSPEMGDVFG